MQSSCFLREPFISFSLVRTTLINLGPFFLRLSYILSIDIDVVFNFVVCDENGVAHYLARDTFVSCSSESRNSLFQDCLRNFISHDLLI